MTSPLRAFGSGTRSLAGEPGDLVLVAVGAEPEVAPAPHRMGFFPTPPATVFALGVLGPGGAATVPFTAPRLPPGTQAARFGAQGVSGQGTQTVAGSASAAVLLLDDAL